MAIIYGLYVYLQALLTSLRKLSPALAEILQLLAGEAEPGDEARRVECLGVVDLVAIMGDQHLI